MKDRNINMRLFLSRHALTDWNEQKRFQGQSDVPLNELGFLQADALADSLKPLSLDYIYASDLERTRQTAYRISKHHQCPIFYKPELRELNFGEWEGLTYQDIQNRYPSDFDNWRNNQMKYVVPMGESLAELSHRVSAFLNKLSSRHPNETILVVAHGGSLQVMLCLALDIPSYHYWQFRISPASLSELRIYSTGVVINYLNDTRHLAALDDKDI